MEIVTRDLYETYGRYTVWEGDVMTPEYGEVTCCWVELDGVRVSAFGGIDAAIELARGRQDREAVDQDSGLYD